MKHILGLVLLLPLWSIAQEQGIQFDKTSSWSEVRARAKAENKFIFMDCFTTWCGPCKMMSKDIFPLKEVGDFMNDKFISIKVQMDKTTGDNEYVKSWYNDADSIAINHKVSRYPTYLYFSPQGNLVHIDGGRSNAVEFLGKAKAALDPKTQYYANFARSLEANKNNPDSLMKMARESKNAGIFEDTDKLVSAYLKTQSDIYSKKNLLFIAEFSRATESRFVDFLVREKTKVDKIMGKGWSTGQRIYGLMLKETFSRASRMKPVDLEALKDSVALEHPEDAEQIMAVFKINHSIWNGAGPKSYQLIMHYLDKYPNGASLADLVMYSSVISRTCQDSGSLNQAFQWVQEAMKANNDDKQTLLAYAGILYKMGQKEEAIASQERAITKEEKPFLQTKHKETLEMMKRGEKIWN